MNLTAFQQSAFLQALGWAIINSVWQAGIFWGLYHILVSSYSNATSKFKNNISTVFLFSSSLWFIATFFNKLIYLQNKIPGAVPMQTGSSTNFYSVSGGLSLLNLIHLIGMILPYLSAAYLLLLLFFSVKLINSYRNTIFMRYNGLQKPGVEWRLFVDKVSGHMNVTKKIKLWFSKHVDVPATIGFLKPVILIPVASLNQLTTDQLEAIILHELSHIKRNDYLLNLFISLIETILFFNPFIVLLSDIIKKERENCCDDFVLQYQYDRHSYASALLSLEKYRIQNLPLVLAATSGKKQLLLRIKRIMEVKNRAKSLNYGQKLLALLLITGMICSIAWLTPGKRSQSYNGKQLQKKLAGFNPDTNQGKNIFLKSKGETKINDVLSSKIIKDKRIHPIDIYEKSNSPEKNKGTLFTENEIHNSPKLTGAYGSSVVMAPNRFLNPAIFTGADNLFSLPKFSLTDLKFLQDLSFFIDINRLEAQVEKSSQSFSSIDWDNVQREIIENLEKIKLTSAKINIEKNKITSVITTNKTKREKEENLKNKFQFSFISDSRDNIPTWNIETGSNDSLFTKNNNSSDSYSNRIFYEQSDETNFTLPPPIPEKRQRTIKVSHRFYNHMRIHSDDDRMPATDVYGANREKSPIKQSTIQIGYKDGSIIINGKKIYSSELKKYHVQAIRKKLSLDCNSQTVEISTKN